MFSFVRFASRRKSTLARLPRLGRLATIEILSRSFSQLQAHYGSDHEFFRYTTAERSKEESAGKLRSDKYFEFNVNELCSVAAKSCGAEKCTGIKKLNDDGKNRVLSLRLDNGKEVVARLPLPNTGPPHLLTASEVATLDFVKNVMDIPAPKVLAWSSRAESTPIGAEFIILEKVDGVPLASVPSWRDGERREWPYFKKLLIQMVRTDEKYTKHRIAKYGSLFYREDVVGYPHTLKIFEDQSQDNEVTRKFAIGPSMSSHLWRDERRLLDVDRGPWSTPVEYATGRIRCQQEWLRKFAKPRLLEDPAYVSAEDNDPQNHITALDDCLEAFSLAMPHAYASPTIWHPDSHQGNLFVTRDEGKRYQLSGMIDWQFTSIGPFFHQVKTPNAFRYTGTRVEATRGTAEVDLPDNFDELPEDEKKLVRKEEFDAIAHVAYKDCRRRVPELDELIGHFHYTIVMNPFFAALDSWERGLDELQFQLLVLTTENNWNAIVPDHERPFFYTEGEESRILRNFRRLGEYQKRFASIDEKLASGDYDWTTADDVEEYQYDECLRMLDDYRIAQARAFNFQVLNKYIPYRKFFSDSSGSPDE
ncbi:hypothetical protein SCHPADRAFT_549770 [Schizopora paradoxa]|uniref:Aminoglycoside phosphotransferase domain-containing protein n=1 Tax=Schizopora paradoxa TaxID=27342 RepID=A0A0H2RJY8_9AGAM|nr:hypothetical protein SCHPADRAFT_549770 [Schizopora paradoxa]